VAQWKLDLMARYFSYDAFCALNVAHRRTDNQFYKVDGQERDIVAGMVGLTEVPCLVWESESEQHEALIFDRINSVQGRTTLAPHEQFRVAVSAKREPAFTAFEFITSIGLSVGLTHGQSDSADPTVIGFADCLVKTFKDPVCARNAILAQMGILQPTEVMVAELHKGFWHIFNRGVDFGREEIKILRLIGRGKIMTRIGVLAAVAGEGKSGSRRAHGNFCAYGILAALNDRLPSSKQKWLEGMPFAPFGYMDKRNSPARAKQERLDKRTAERAERLAKRTAERAERMAERMAKRAERLKKAA
jgi:hypothetical protein